MCASVRTIGVAFSGLGSGKMNQAKVSVIDADAHVIENDHTWDFLEPAEAKYRPKKIVDPDVPDAHYWRSCA